MHKERKRERDRKRRRFDDGSSDTDNSRITNNADKLKRP